jgi:alkyl hydroperoxide reductase subunit F
VAQSEYLANRQNFSILYLLIFNFAFNKAIMYDLIIIGGGPAGAAAGVYAARKKLKTALITKDFGGQSKVSPDIQNWIGTVSISGAKLAENLKKHLEAYISDVLKIEEGEKVTSVVKSNEGFSVKTESGKQYETKTVLVCAGSNRRKLEIPGADKFEHKGLTYCATCDGPLFTDKNVIVIGGGNAGFETAAQLLAYTKSVTLLHKDSEFKASPITVDKVLTHPNMKAFTNIETIEIKGDKMVNAIVYKDLKTNNVTELPTDGIFVEIGQIPTTEFVKDLVEFNNYKQIVIDPWTQKTSQEGVWAAGDTTNILYHQNNIAAGDAIKAVEDIYVTLHTK